MRWERRLISAPTQEWNFRAVSSSLKIYKRSAAFGSRPRATHHHCRNAAETLACFVGSTASTITVAPPQKSTCRLQADARVSACDDSNFTPQVYAMERLPRRRL